MLNTALGVRAYLSPQMQGEHLCAKADSQKWFFFLQRDTDPVNFPADKIIGVIGALRSAKNYGPGVVFKRFREGVAISRTADIEFKTVGLKPVANMTRR